MLVFIILHSVPFNSVIKIQANKCTQLCLCYNNITLTTNSCMHMFRASLVHHKGTHYNSFKSAVYHSGIFYVESPKFYSLNIL